MALFALDGLVPEVADTSWVAPNATVLGAVSLAEGSSVWFGAVLRGDTVSIRVGQGSNVQDNSVLHTDAGYPLDVGEDCTIGHGAILHGCTIGAGSLVGMGATVLNGARIGTRCLIGANSLVTANSVIPDGSMAIGTPAKVVRLLRAEELDMLEASAAHYRTNARRFSAGVKPLPLWNSWSG